MLNALGLTATFWNLGIPEMLLIFGIIIMFFGAKRIPEIARSLGSGIKEFKTSLTAPDEEETKPEEKIDENKKSETTQTNP